VRTELAGRRVLVVGGSGGLGSAISSRLAGEGMRVAVHHHTNAEAARAIAEGIREAGSEAFVVSGDVTTKESVDGIIDGAQSQLGGSVEILVYCAGEIQNSAGWLAESPETLQHAFLINAAGAVYCAQAVYPQMREAGWGRIVNISTIYGALEPSAAVLSYSMAKAALDAATKALAAACAEGGVTVNAIAPGNFDTEMTRRAGPDYISYIRDQTPLKRLGRPVEVADAVMYLCASEFTTGATLVLDGGLSCPH
jgi:3-oxoacyl-[acyl-carrier protein] reductase